MPPGRLRDLIVYIHTLNTNTRWYSFSAFESFWSSRLNVSPACPDDLFKLSAPGLGVGRPLLVPRSRPRRPRLASESCGLGSVQGCVVFCQNKQRSFQPFMCLRAVLFSRSLWYTNMSIHKANLAYQQTAVQLRQGLSLIHI